MNGLCTDSIFSTNNDIHHRASFCSAEAVQLGQCRARPFRFHQVCFFFISPVLQQISALTDECAPTDNAYDALKAKL